MDEEEYKKKPGTSGISGQLYETKLISLILFRLLHDEQVEEFCLASNMADTGAFDDICFRVKITGLERPILIFIQAKHKDDVGSSLKYDLIKNCHESLVKVKENFCSNNNERLFKGKFEEMECLFILYTDAKFYEDDDFSVIAPNPATISLPPTRATTKQKRTQYQSNFAKKLSKLIGTDDEKSQGSQADYNEKDLEFVNNKIIQEEFTTVAEHFTKFLNDQSMNILLDKYMALYHVIIAQTVVHISEVRTEEIKNTKKEKIKKTVRNPDCPKATVTKFEPTLGLKTETNTKFKHVNENAYPNENAHSNENKSGRVTEHMQDNQCKESIPGPSFAITSVFNKSAQQKLLLTGNKNDKKIYELTDVKSENNESEQITKTQDGNQIKTKEDKQLSIKSKVTKSNSEQKGKQSDQIEVRRYRQMSFRHDFIFTNNENLLILRNKLYEIIINNQIRNKKKQKDMKKESSRSSSTTNLEETKIEEQVSAFLSEPSAIGLSLLIETHIIYQNGNLKFIVERPESDLHKLDYINTTTANLSMIVKDAEINAARNILLSLELKVPATFGNIDITIAGDDKKVQKRLNILKDVIEKLCSASESDGLNDIVTIDKSIGEGFLSLTGGLGSAVGNLLVYDDATKLLKFTEDSQSLKENARDLFDKLIINTNISSKFYSYRIKSKANFPKLKLDFTDEARNILSKVVVYDKQGNHTKVEKILKEEIESNYNSNQPHNFLEHSDKVVIYYHNVIQQWWMSAKSKYLTEKNDYYQKSLKNIFIEPQISALHTTFITNHINIFRYEFNKHALEILTLEGLHSRIIITTNISIMTTMKVIQSLKKQTFAIVHIEYMLNMLNEDFSALNSELKSTKKVLILVCDKPKVNRILHKRLEAFTESTENKKLIIITDSDFLETAQEYFESAVTIINDERTTLADLTQESRRDLIKNCLVIFQGETVNLDLLVDGESVGFVNGAVLNKIVRSETVIIGKSLNNSNYEKILHLYIERKVHLASNYDINLFYDDIGDDHLKIGSNNKGRSLKRFTDIDEDVVLITAAPGMGKSTLLTRLSLKTKKDNKGLWIVRVNLLDHSKSFYDWQIHNTVIDILETLKILCRVILQNNNLPIHLAEIGGNVYLESSTRDVWADFEINMFLYFYNKRKILFLFDGFDEICPHYKETVIKFLNVVISYPKKHNMWVTSRPYSEILPDLQKVLGKAYELEYINDTDQAIYVKRYWQENLIINNLNEEQLKNVVSFIDFMRANMRPVGGRIVGRIFYLLYEYIIWYFPHINNYGKLTNKIPVVLNPVLTELNGGFVQRRVDIVMGTPLLLYLHADYFVNMINSENTVDWKLSLQDSMLIVYEMYVQSKLKRLFQMDVYKPDMRRRYEEDYLDCLDLHKKLAAHTLFFRRIHLDELKDLKPFKEEGEYESIVNKMKCGIEKIGLISHVSADNIPVFIYKSLEEYFATEFLCEAFRNDAIDFACKNILYSIAHITLGIFPWLNKKRAIDNDLNSKVRDIERKRIHTADTYGYIFATGWSVEHLIRIRSSTADDYEIGCFDEYNESCFKVLRRLEEEERNKTVKEIQKHIIEKMKPHLRRYFTPLPEDNTETS